MDGLTLDSDMQLGALQKRRGLTDEQIDQGLAVLLVAELGESVMRVGLDGVHCELQARNCLHDMVRIHSRLLSVSLTVTTILKECSEDKRGLDNMIHTFHRRP